jgi:hypothetical protein
VTPPYLRSLVHHNRGKLGIPSGKERSGHILMDCSGEDHDTEGDQALR